MRILISDRRAQHRRQLLDCLADPRIECAECESQEQMLGFLQRLSYDVVVLGSICSSTFDRNALIERIRIRRPECAVLILGDCRIEEIARTMLISCVGPSACNPRVLAGVPAPVSSLLGQSEAMSAVRRSTLKAALVEANVLITGETGTGKEVAARLIHESSNRKEKLLICVNCAAIPDALLESELFGHEKGAFTGAEELRCGKLEQANGGTIFLDEIGDMSPAAQAKLLRALEHKEIHRLGASRGVTLSFRVIAATNRDLNERVRAGAFRSDLFFRLNVWLIKLPPLRERKEDISELCDAFIEQLNERFHRTVSGVSEAALDKLTVYDWPGNVRELRNALEYAFINTSRDLIVATDLPDWLAAGSHGSSNSSSEREHLIDALVSCRWNKSKAARKLKWSRMTLYRKLAKHELTNADEAAAV